MAASKVDDKVPELIPLEDLNDISDISEASDSEEPRIHPDTVPQQKLIINKIEALERVYQNISTAKYSWIDTQVISETEIPEIKDIHDDLEKETLFYNQALKAVEIGKKKVTAAGVPFSRPNDFFAEMVKSDEHMTKIRQRLLDEAKDIESSQKARKQRELKKMGKKIQIEKLKERDEQKRLAKESINNLKRKLKDQEFGDEDEFDINLDEEEETSAGNNKRAGGKGGKGPNKRVKKDAKFGYGGKKRGSKRNTKESTSSMDDGYSVKKNKSAGFSNTTKKFKPKGQRPGKSKRMNRRSK